MVAPDPLPPLAALEYFLSLIPIPGITDPGRWGEDRHRVAFTLAAATEENLLKKVFDLLGDALLTGEVGGTPDAVDELLDLAGVSPRNPQYAEMVTRTNIIEAYNQGAWEEMQAASEDFPAWRYEGVRDGRQREAHEVHFGKYFPSSVSFASVRDSMKGAYDGFNCRCTFRPVSAGEWRRLQSRGVTFAGY